MDCRVCGRPTNRIMIRRGTGICCEICERIAMDRVTTLEKIKEAMDYLWSINTTTALDTYADMGRLLENATNKKG